MTMTADISPRLLASRPSTSTHPPAVTDRQDMDVAATVRLSGSSSGSARVSHSDNFSAGVMFSVLADWWHETTDSLPPRRKIEHTAYQRIIAYGEPMVPHILRDLRDRGGDWYVALKEITQEWPIQPSDEGLRPLMRDAWYQWGVANGYVV